MSESRSEFVVLWARLKTELNLCDKDLEMGYKIQISNSIAVLGYLGRGKVSLAPTYYPHPSSAERSAKSFCAKNEGYKYKILPWEKHLDSVMR